MVVEKVVWTTLPNHMDQNKRLRLSVHVGPRLVNDDGSSTPRKLGECPAFVNWPARLSTLKFRVEFENAPKFPAIPQAQADKVLWTRLFPPNTPLTPFVFQDHSSRDLHVFPVRGILQFMADTYGSVAAVGTNHLPIDDPFGPLASFNPIEHLTLRISDSPSFWQELSRARQPKRGTGRVVRDNVASPSLPLAQQEVQNRFFEAYRYYYRPGSQNPDLPAGHIEPSPTIPELDFHQRVTAIADHPAVLRMLGLVIDLLIEDPHVHVPTTGLVRVVPEGDLPENPPVCPWTRYELDAPWFGAQPGSKSRMSRGLLNLSPDFYDVFQVDLDGAAIQTVGFADTLRRLRDPDRRSDATPDKVTVPALHSGGLALARFQRGDVLLQDLLSHRSQNAEIEAGQSTIFNAEDLVRGYRVDVYDANAPGGARWFSLHRRVANHVVKGAVDGEASLSFKIVDEGYVKATAASSERADHPTASDDLYLHETLFGWEGWSLSAPRPGKRIVEPGAGDNGSTLARYDPAADNPSPLVTTLVPEPKTLPRLRIGHKYHFRARTVDLAGNSRPASDTDLELAQPVLASSEHTYLRFEPVPSPTVLRRHVDTEGESLEQLVIRSDLGITAADYATMPEVQQALKQAGAQHTYAAQSERHLAPPKCSQLMAEQGGRFDAAFGGSDAEMTTALRVALREEGTFLDEDIVDITTGQKTSPQSTISLFPPGSGLPARRGDGLPGGAYAFYPDDNVVLPYLPDPSAVGVSLTGYDYADAEIFHEVAMFPGSWPSLQPLRLRLSEGTVGITFANGVVEVQLPKAEVVRARLASVFPDARLEDFGVWQWISPTAKTDTLKKAAVEGRHWMLTPFRWVTFTHAVQHPLAVPDMTKVESSRSFGSTFAEFRGVILNHAKSTGRLDVLAEWTEDVDLLTDDVPRMRALGTEVPHQAHAFAFDIEPSENQAQVDKPGRISRHEFADTKYRRIVYHSVATTRFREYFPRPIADDPNRIQRIESTTDNGTVKPGLVHDILNSSRPAAPDIAYVLPTFRWERQGGGTLKHIRHGKGLRVWLRRPWFSSGDGEQLAVVLEPGVQMPRGWEHLTSGVPLSSGITTLTGRSQFPHTAVAPLPLASEHSPLSLARSTAGARLGAIIANAAKMSDEDLHAMLVSYVTNWGSDPVWDSALPKRPPTVADFPRNAGYASGLTLEELPEAAQVDIAAHEVYFDKDRKLWYCDIEVDPGDSYFPFVRLALARYQPHSVVGAHLSRVVMSDFIQLAPDRTAEVSVSGGMTTVTVQGFAGRNHLTDIPANAQTFFSVSDMQPSGRSNARSTAPLGVATRNGPSPNTTMRAVLQRRVVGIPGELGWQDVSAEVVLHPSASDFHVTWTGLVPVPVEGNNAHRLLVSEVETFLRSDLVPGDPNLSRSPLDFVRERVVYADVFEL